jgi:poly(A) polymerase
VLYRLKNAGYEAYLVGGCVRDLLLGREPKDFDVATNARPEQVKELFRNCRLIGRRFRLAHVHFGNDIVEVATFRAQHDTDGGGEGEMRDGMIVRDNVYGTIEQDAWRRDFTVNALYYNIEDFSVVDYTQGLPDLRAGVLRTIGDPRERFREDPVRMLRMVRFAAKLGFRIDAASESAIYELHESLRNVPPARLFDEIQKLFMSGYAVAAYERLRHYRLFEHLFPGVEASLAAEREGFPLTLVARGLINTDKRVNEAKSVTPAFLFAVLLWDAVRVRADALRAQGKNDAEAMNLAAAQIVSEQSTRVAIPKRFSIQAKEIWGLQQRLRYRNGRRPLRLLEHPRFRAGYDFLLLRTECGEENRELSEWWTDFQYKDDAARDIMLNTPRNNTSPARRRRRRRKKRPEPGP